MKDSEILAKAKELTADFLTQMGLDSDIEASFMEMDEESDIRYLEVKLEGENLNELIGHHGKNLEAAQIVLGLMLSKQIDSRDVRVVVEINDYREGREKYLKSHAQRAADQVRETGQEIELMPMKPSERRIIHIALKDDDDIETESVGDYRERRVVIQKKKS
ncbi:MAG: protein jag [Candidatus Dojkabacteria bacterium]